MSRVKQWRSSSARGLSSVFGLITDKDRKRELPPVPRREDSSHHSYALASEVFIEQSNHYENNSEPAPTTTAKRGRSTRRERRNKEPSTSTTTASSSAASGGSELSPKVPPLPVASWRSALEPPLSPPCPSSPSGSPGSCPPSKSCRGYRKFSLPTLEVTSSAPHADGATSSTSSSPSTPVSPRRLLHSLSASLRALRVYARTSADEFEVDNRDRYDDRRGRSGGGSDRKGAGSERRERAVHKKLASPTTSSSSLGSVILPTSPDTTTSTSSPASSHIRTKSSSSSSSSSSVSSASKSIGAQLDQVSTSEGYQLLFGALAIKVVYHRFKPPVANTRSAKRTDTVTQNDGEGDEGVHQPMPDPGVSAEHLLRKYFFAEQEEKRMLQLKKEEIEGDDVSIIALSDGELTFDCLIARLAELYGNGGKLADVDNDLAVFYEKGDGERVQVRDSASLTDVWRDWRHRQQRLRHEMKEEERRERRERWTKKMEQIEQNERETKKEMLTRIGNMKLMLKSRTPRQQMLASKEGETESVGEARRNERDEEGRGPNEPEMRRREKRGISLKLHVYEQEAHTWGRSGVTIMA